MLYLTRKAEFAASHYYHNPALSPEENGRLFGKCNNPNGHGHNYVLEVTVKGEIDPRSGFVVDLKQLKETMHREVLDAMDHRFLNKEVPEFLTRIPTTENPNSVKTVFSAAVTLTVRKKPAVTQQPLPTIVEEGQSAFFEAAASGFPAPSVQWEYSTDSGITWVNAPSGTSDKLTVANTKTTFSGREYRATFSNTAGEAVTEAVELTVRKAPAVTKSPTSVTTEEGHSATFEASASGSPAPSVQWELSTDGGANWATIGGATSTQYTIASVTTGESGYQYRATFENEAGKVASGAATLTVHTLPVVTSQPGPQTLEEGQPATFEAQASGFPAPSVQWEVSVNNGNTWTAVSGATSTTFTIASAKTSENAHQFRATFTNSAGKASSSSALLTVRKFPAVTKQPTSATFVEGQNATFEATASGFPTPSVQWEVSSDEGASWSTVAGATSSKLTLTAVTVRAERLPRTAPRSRTPPASRQRVGDVDRDGAAGDRRAAAEHDRRTGPERRPRSAGDRRADADRAVGTLDNAGNTWSAISGATSEQLTDRRASNSAKTATSSAPCSRTPPAKSTTAAVTLTVATTHYTTVGWGQNRFRELGDGTANSISDTPVTAVGLHFVTAVASGGTHSLALRRQRHCVLVGQQRIRASSATARTCSAKPRRKCPASAA